MLALWGKIKNAIDENEREHQRMLEITDPEETTIVPIYNRDYLLQFDHLVLFEDILHKYHIKIASFKNVEGELNNLFSQVADNLEDEIKTDIIPLHYENNTLMLTKEFDVSAAPFHYFLSHHGLELETRLSAIELRYSHKDTIVKTTMLNELRDDEMPFFILDGHPVMPSNLTLFLKYALRYLDESKLTFNEEEEYMLWERNFQSMAMMFDFIRQHKDYRSQIVDVIINHCNEYYKIPKDIAAALRVHVTEQKVPYHSSDFKIHLDFVPPSTPVNALSGSLTVLYF